MNILRMIFVVGVVVFGFYYVTKYYFPEYAPEFLPREKADKIEVSIKGENFRLDVADSDEERTKGLGERDEMGPDEGMIFFFDNPGRHGIWMKGMRFPIDIIWLHNNIIVDIEPNIEASFETNQRVYSPKALADTVIELNAGTARRLDLEISNSIMY